MKKTFITLAIVSFVFVCVAYGVVRHCLYTKYSNERAVEYLDSHAEGRSKGRCALYVRLAIEAGGVPTFGQPLSACDYERFLPELAFHKVDDGSYKPRKGDVVVFSAIKGHPHGHIAMYDGKQWVSDFKQSKMHSASGYKKEGSRSFWRREDGWAWRRVTLQSCRKALTSFFGI